MRKRRLIVILGVLALIAAGAAWWWSSLDRLSAEERKLVGLWRYAVDGDDRQWRVEFAPDRRVLCGFPNDDLWELGRWSVRDGTIVMDREASPFLRAGRPVALRLGVSVGPI